MSCCAPGAGDWPTAGGSVRGDEFTIASRDLGNGLRQLDLVVPDIHCAACIHKVETAVSRLHGVETARVNLSSKRLSVRWRGENVPALGETLANLGYAAHVHDVVERNRDPMLARLLRALGVAGFAAGNIMLLSVSVWAGADGPTRDLFHWLSALLAVPALVYSGAVFYGPAWTAIRHGRTNMDVPIAIGLTLAFGMSLYETATHSSEAYFDASVSLLFFLLIGRTLDHVMREKARSAVSNLRSLSPRGATVLAVDGAPEYRPLAELAVGDRMIVAAGERIPLDGRVVEGASEIDRALVTGESALQMATRGDTVQAGTVNVTGPLTIEATALAENSFLAETARLMEAAEEGRARYRLIADRAAALYAPLVHSAALLTFLGWLWTSGDWHRAIETAIAVLIITCPCALGLAVPMVQIVAARRLFECGILMKDGSALERLAAIDTVVFDKTGTITTGEPRLVGANRYDAAVLGRAATLAAHSCHPYSQAIVCAAAGRQTGRPGIGSVREVAGCGLEGVGGDGAVYRLGRSSWALPNEHQVANDIHITLARNGIAIGTFDFDNDLRGDAREAAERLSASGLDLAVLSGDRASTVRRAAEVIGVTAWRAEQMPADKVAYLAELARNGHRALMVGDGLNDAPALAAASVSMTPVTAADIGRAAADFVFTRESLLAVPFAFRTALRARRLVYQNLLLAAVYNIIAVPVAASGHVTPLVAAIAMSLSSLTVVANAMRLGHDPVQWASGLVATLRLRLASAFGSPVA